MLGRGFSKLVFHISLYRLMNFGEYSMCNAVLQHNWLHKNEFLGVSSYYSFLKIIFYFVCSGYSTFLQEIIYDYFPPFSKYSFYSLVVSFDTKVLNFDTVKYVCFISCSFGVIFMKSLTNPMWRRFSFMDSSKKFIFSSYILSLIQFKLNVIYGVR